MNKLVIATRNPGKVAEISALLDSVDIELLSLSEFSNMPDIVEDGATFIENAMKKARETFLYTGCTALADDSGIVVDALDGQPGVHSARFADTNNARIAKMLCMLADVPDGLRTARFICALAVVMPDGEEWTTEDSCEGIITRQPSGCGGFGYDPIFLYPPLNKTFAQIPCEEKNRISHRGKAFQRFKNAVMTGEISLLKK